MQVLNNIYTLFSEVNPKLLSEVLKNISKILPELPVLTRKAVLSQVIAGITVFKKKIEVKGRVNHYKSVSTTDVYHSDEPETLLDKIEDNRFNLFVRFAYYTGARSGEIRSISRENIFSNHIVAYGKSGKRLIKLNNQAQKIISELDELWNYSKDFVSHKFKKEAKRLGIPDIRFHDLRRTFGYNLIRQGRPIHEVSKLLGHSSVTTTERHYAPLLATEIDDFVL